MAELTAMGLNSRAACSEPGLEKKGENPLKRTPMQVHARMPPAKLGCCPCRQEPCGDSCLSACEAPCCVLVLRIGARCSVVWRGQIWKEKDTEEDAEKGGEGRGVGGDSLLTRSTSLRRMFSAISPRMGSLSKFKEDPSGGPLDAATGGGAGAGGTGPGSSGKPQSSARFGLVRRSNTMRTQRGSRGSGR